MKSFFATALFCAALAVPCVPQTACDQNDARQIVQMITEGGIASRTFNGAATVRYDMKIDWYSWTKGKQHEFVSGVRGVEQCLNGVGVTVHFSYAGDEVAKASPITGIDIIKSTR